MNTVLYFDNLLLNWIYSFKNPILDRIVPFITSLGDGGIIWISICVILLFFKKTRKCAVTVALGLLLNLVICNGILKNLFMRIRPYEINGIKELLVPFPDDFSFPSGHSSSSFVAATSIFIYYKKSGFAALCLAFLIALSRLYLYVHYPTDVFFGGVTGVILAFFSYYIINNISGRKSRKILK